MSWFKDVGKFLSDNVIKPIDRHIVKPIDRHIVKPIDRHVVKPIERHIVKPIDRHVVKPIDEHVVQPIGEHVVKPIDEHVIQPINEHVVNPIREKVDHDFAVSDEIAAFEAVHKIFRDRYQAFADRWADYATSRVTYERLSEEFEGELDRDALIDFSGVVSETPFTDDGKVSLEEFFEVDHLAKVLTGQTIVGYFKRIDENEARIERQTNDLKASTVRLEAAIDRLNAEIKRLDRESARLQDQYGEGGSINAAQIEQARLAARADFARKLASEGMAPGDIAEMTGWSVDFVATALSHKDPEP